MVEFLKPDLNLIRYIADNMREADRVEVWASHHHTPIQSLMLGWGTSSKSVVIAVDGTPCVMIGLVVGGVLSGRGTPWMLGTADAVRHKRYFITLVPDIISEMLDTCTTLCNHVHADNHVSVTWLKRLGFKLDPAKPFGVEQELFYKFRMRGE